MTSTGTKASLSAWCAAGWGIPSQLRSITISGSPMPTLIEPLRWARKPRPFTTNSRAFARLSTAGQSGLETTIDKKPLENKGKVDARYPKSPSVTTYQYPLGESNPCLRTENPMSWATRRRGRRAGTAFDRRHSIVASCRDVNLTVRFFFKASR